MAENIIILYFLSQFFSKTTLQIYRKIIKKKSGLFGAKKILWIFVFAVLIDLQKDMILTSFDFSINVLQIYIEIMRKLKKGNNFEKNSKKLEKHF